MMLQLNPTIPVETFQGKGQAYLVIDYGKGRDLGWLVFLDATGQSRCFRNEDVRLLANQTMRPADPGFAETAADKPGVVGADVFWVVHDGCECSRCVLSRAMAEGRVSFDDKPAEPPESRRYRWTCGKNIIMGAAESYDPNEDHLFSHKGQWVRSERI